jgi:hypothetical protein
MKTLTFVVLVGLLLAGCGGHGGGGHGGSGKVEIDCVDLRNTGDEDACAVGAVTASVSAIDTRLRTFAETGISAVPTNVDLGQISRNTEAQLSATVDNSTGDEFTGLVVYSTDLDCAGRTEPWVMGTSVIIVPAGENIETAVSQQCSDASLGTHTITITVYQQDGITMVDQVIGTFVLVE